jgi:ATP-dependent DNA helicase RecQ
MLPTPQSILKTTFGYDSFLPTQKEVIDHILAGKDTLAIMPTGGGKSLCYQIPALIFPGLTVVVSPLISLMKDQVEQLHTNGVPAAFLNSTVPPQVYQETMDQVKRGEIKLLYLAPETLLTPRIFALLDSIQLSLFTIDEAHCISEWGHDFRPEYRQLVSVRKRYPKAVCLALTATATVRVRADIRANLGFGNSNEFVASFDRKNLYIAVEPKTAPQQQTIRFLKRFPNQSGIIYCFSRKQVEDLAEFLRLNGFQALPYHAGLDDGPRRRNQEAFIRDDAQIIVATIAFGMGINKPNVRFVLHYDLPKSIENYYQEIGRAGRDGLPAHCLLLYGRGDLVKQGYFIKEKTGNERKAAEEHLQAMADYAEDLRTCRRKPILHYFGEIYKAEKCNNCDHCNQIAPVQEDITVPAQKFMSCIIRTGENFGAKHIIDVLRGSRGQKVLRFQHEQLSTYGIGKEWTDKQWQFLATQLLQMGYLEEMKEYHTLAITAQGRLALKNRSHIYGLPLPAPEPTGRPAFTKLEEDHNRALYAILRVKRKELADEANIPPYMVLSDRSLMELATYLPHSLERMEAIYGFGQNKLKVYGQIFLQDVIDFCQKHNLGEKPFTEKAAASRTVPDGSKRFMVVGKAYTEGDSITELAEKFQIKPGTVLEYLHQYALVGEKLTARQDLLDAITATPEQVSAAMAAFDEAGIDKLKPVFELLHGELSYDELRLLRLIYLSRAG